MAAEPPIFNNNEHNTSYNEITGTFHPAPPIVESPIDAGFAGDDEETPTTQHFTFTLTGQKSAFQSPGSALDPITPEVHLTPRQQRVLKYLARRRMRNARIIKRSPPASAV